MFWLIASAQFAASFVASGAWLWYSSWHQSAIRKMSDELVNTGVIDAEELASIRSTDGSVFHYIDQGWGSPAAISGWILVILCFSAPVVTCSVNHRRG